jgi:hypothetical protein
MFESVTESSDARVALYLVAAAMIGSIVMTLVANFLG